MLLGVGGGGGGGGARGVSGSGIGKSDEGARAHKSHRAGSICRVDRSWK